MSNPSFVVEGKMNFYNVIHNIDIFYDDFDLFKEVSCNRMESIPVVMWAGVLKTLMLWQF